MIDNYTLHGYHKRVHIVTMRIATERRGGFLPTAYAYNLRSWVTHISSPLFSQRLSYGEPSDGGQPRYGGGVSAMDWQAAGDSLRGYRYQYDALGRLAAADYREGGLPSDRYVTEYSYDLMGNILTLSRSGKVYDEIYGVTDDLTYQYDGNRLIRVTNHAADTPAYKDAMYYVDGADLDTERTYDANGNMTSNADSRISRISYDALNMPCRIDYIDGSHIDYTYVADGVKQRVDYYLNPYTSSLPDDDLGTACDSSLLVHTWREYAGNCVYVCDTLSMILIDGGYITFDYTTHQPIYHYYLKDYLGNNRITVSLADGRIEEVNHYYPFGGLMGDSRNATTQPYKYIGKELDRTQGLNWYDHGARHYDPVTGRWNVMDALAEKYYPWSPYVSCLDNPIIGLDVDGCKTYLYVTQLPGNNSSLLKCATHTFIAVIQSDRLIGYFAYGPEEDGMKGMSGGRLMRCYYQQDYDVINKKNSEALKSDPIEIAPPKGMTKIQFDKKVIEVANSFGNNKNIKYSLYPSNETTGNCNSSSSTILHKAGISKEILEIIKENMKGITWGFGNVKPWTKEEQDKAVKKEEEKQEELINEIIKNANRGH